MSRKFKGYFFFFDLDGTLAPIADHPDNAKMDPFALEWIRSALKQRNTKIAIVTGRSKESLCKVMPLGGLYLLTNHGMEVFYKGRRLLAKGDSFREPLKGFAEEMKSSLAHIKGVLIEDKGLSVAVHYRCVAKPEQGMVKTLFREIAGKARPLGGLEITKGKMVLELRPALHWNKGSGVLWLWKKVAPKYYPIYVGDDVTDEDAFKALQMRGLTIRIGKKRGSFARYYARGIKDVLTVHQEFNLHP